MNYRNNWYVITGGPSTGKTTVLNQLKKRGFAVVPEAARWVIEHGFAEGLSMEEIRGSEQGFQEDVMHRKILQEAEQNPREITFFDRGMHDTIAYYALYNHEPPDWVQEAIDKSWYRHVFVLDSLGFFKEGGVRVETAESAAWLNEKLYDAYNQAGFPITRVPAMEPEKRADFILDVVRRYATLDK